MSTIIKATDRNAGVHGVAFNFDDMATKAGQYLEEVRAQAAKIVVSAQQEADGIRKQAEIEGRRMGRQAIEETVKKQLVGQLSTLLPALRQVVEDVQHAKQAWLTHWEKSAVHVAAAIAGRLVRRELPNRPEIPLVLLREALELSAGSSQLRILMNPADHKTLASGARALIEELSAVADAELIADAQISPGGCRVETRFGTIDQQFEAQIARIEEELT